MTSNSFIRSLDSLSMNQLVDFTDNFQIPILSRMHYHSASPNSSQPLSWGSLNHSALQNISLEDIDKHCHYPEAVPSLESINFTGRNVLVLGSSVPWLEVYLLLKNVSKIFTVEYRSIKWKLDSLLASKWSYMNFSQFQDHVSSGATDCSIDTVISYSSIEHSGLGRYGDPIDPDGDLKTLDLLSRFVSPSADYFLALPFGRDSILFNRHRVYGIKRLKKITQILGRSRISKVAPKKNILRSSLIDSCVFDQSLDSILKTTDIGSDGIQLLIHL